MDNDIKTSDYSMSDFYKVLKWIPRSLVDRQEPVIVSDELINGEDVVFPTIYEEFNGIDEVQIFINFNNCNVDASKILLDFSPMVNGKLSLLQVKCNNAEMDYNNDTIISFKLDDNHTFTDQTRVITGVNSLKLTFGTTVTGVKINKILMRCQNYTYTLTDIENFLITGENYVLGKVGRYLENNKIPESLRPYIYMAGGAYAWLSRWEYETKPMKENKAEADNYATRLLNQVNSAISEYIDNIENNLEHKDLCLAASEELLWGL